MASDCPAPVLVGMLNELVGKFEQLAQVSRDLLFYLLSVRSFFYLLTYLFVPSVL